MWKSSLLVFLGISLAAGAALAQAQDFDKVTIKTTKVAEGLYMLEGAGGNIGVSVGEDGVILIDDQYAPRPQTCPGTLHLETHVPLAVQAVMDEQVNLAELREQRWKTTAA